MDPYVTVRGGINRTIKIKGPSIKQLWSGQAVQFNLGHEFDYYVADTLNIFKQRMKHQPPWLANNNQNASSA